MIKMSKSSIRATVTGIAVLGCAAAVTVSAPRAVFAQAADANADKPISINMQNTPIQAVLKVLFNSVGANYSIDSDVQGNVNITMNNVGFLAALRSILHATNPPLTYDYTDGVYHIRVKKQEVVQTQGSGTVTPDQGTQTNTNTEGATAPSTSSSHYYKLPVDHYDVIEMAQLIARSNSNTVELVPSAMGMSGGMGGTGAGVGMAGMTGGMGGMSGGMGMGGMTGGMGMGGMTGGMGGMSGGMGMGGMRGF